MNVNPWSIAYRIGGLGGNSFRQIPKKSWKPSRGSSPKLWNWRQLSQQLKTNSGRSAMELETWKARIPESYLIEPLNFREIYLTKVLVWHRCWTQRVHYLRGCPTRLHTGLAYLTVELHEQRSTQFSGFGRSNGGGLRQQNGTDCTHQASKTCSVILIRSTPALLKLG